MNVTEITAVQARNDIGVLDLAKYSSVESFIQKVFHKGTDDASTPARTDAFDRTSSLIEQASKAIETLSGRCEILSNELDQEKVISSEQETHIDALNRMLLELKGRNATYESDLKTMTLRCQTAEARVAELEESQNLVTLRADSAENISSKLQQKVEAAFGQNSPIWSVMNGVKLQRAAE